ncbi:MAG: YCF48-related protein, partial [Chloroflexota bacterium]
MPTTLGWAVGGNGEAGTILHTADGGAHWSVQFQMPGIGYLRGVAFADAQNGWAVGGNGTILHTGDGGANWSTGTIIGTAHFYINAVTFLDARNAWAAGYGPGSLVYGTPGIGTVYHTTDGGMTWYAQDVGANVYHGSSAFGGIDFADAQHGVATGNSFYGGNEKWRTADGGATWTPFTVPGDALGPVDFLDAQHGWGAGSGILFSSDAGATWSQINPSGFSLRDLEFADSLNGWGVGNGGLVAHTTDGGMTWSEQAAPSGRLDGVAATDALNSWAVGAWGAIVHTGDGGVTWSSQRGAGDYDGG